MHVVTKILVVFVSVLALLLAALTMAWAANAQAIRDSYAAAQNEAIGAKNNANMLVSEIANKQAKDQEQLNALRNELSSKEQDLANLRAGNSTLRAELEQARGEMAAIRNQVADALATAQTQAALIKQLSAEVTESRSLLLDANRTEIELVDRISDLESAREVLDQNLRAVKEQLEESRLALQQAQSGGGVSSALGAATPRELPGPVVRARVSEVFTTPTGDMVVINEGANRGIKEGTRLNIVRGSQFIGTADVKQVEPTQCVAQVTMLSDGARVQKDDTILSRLQ